MILTASTLAQSALPANVGIIVVLVLIIVVFGLGALFWSAITDNKKEPSSPVRVLRAPATPSRAKTEETIVPGPAVVAAPHAAVPMLEEPLAPTAPVEPVVAQTPAETAPIVEEVYLPEEPAADQPAPGEPDDLQRIEGIGPKIAGVLADNGIVTFAQLAAMTPDQIRAILTGKVRLFNPDTWPKQASLAAAGHWDELVEYQGMLKAGRRV